MCPEGFLPAFSVDTEEEANRLMRTACSLGVDGEYYAKELINYLTGEEYKGKAREDAFVRFALKLERIDNARQKSREGTGRSDQGTAPYEP